MPEEVMAALQAILQSEDLNEIKQIAQALLEAGAQPGPEAGADPSLDQGMDAVLAQ